MDDADDLLIGIDAGTSVIKAVAFAADGRQLAAASLPNRYETRPDGGAEQDMARTWTDTARTLAALGEQVPDLARRTCALAVTGQGDGTWLIDAAGEPVAPAWLWLDVRASAIADEVLASPAAARHYATTGTALNACQQSVQLAWLKRHRPELLARAATACHCKDWLYFRLTDERATDPSEASFTYADFRTGRYALDLLEPLGITDLARLLPPVIDGTRTAHPLTAGAARLTGLRAGTPVVLASIDVLCTGLGGGLFERSGAYGCSIFGSTGMHMVLASSAGVVRLNEGRSGYTMPFPVPGMFAQMQSNMAATLNLQWLTGVAGDVLRLAGCARAGEDLLADAEPAVLAAPAAATLFHPYITEAGERGPFLDAHARGQFLGVGPSTDFAGLLRAIYEGLALAARDCYAAMGHAPAEIRIAGGAARSRAMQRVLASVMGVPVRSVGRAEAGAAGAAMIAAVQGGLYPGMDACAAAWVTPLLGAPELPDAAATGLYAELFEVYRSVRTAMPPTWRQLSAIRRRSQSSTTGHRP